MPLIVQQNSSHGGVQLILRPGTPNAAPQLAAKGLAPQNLILQQGGTASAPQVILQHAGGQRGTIQQVSYEVFSRGGIGAELIFFYIAAPAVSARPYCKRDDSATGPHVYCDEQPVEFAAIDAGVAPAAPESDQ